MKIKTVERIAMVVVFLTGLAFLVGGFDLFKKFIIGDMIGIIVALVCALVFNIKPKV